MAGRCWSTPLTSRGWPMPFAERAVWTKAAVAAGWRRCAAPSSGTTSFTGSTPSSAPASTKTSTSFPGSNSSCPRPRNRAPGRTTVIRAARKPSLHEGASRRRRPLQVGGGRTTVVLDGEPEGDGLGGGGMFLSIIK